MSLDWDKLRVFHAAAEAGSFTHAAETLKLSQSAISRQVSALEQDVGVPLFNRHARGLVLTEQGEMLFRTAHDVMMKLESIRVHLSEAKDRPSGVLRVTTTVGLGAGWLTERVQEFLDLYPEINLQLILSNDELDLTMRQADCAIRLRQPQQPDLIQRRLFTVHFHLYAAPSYVTKYGPPANMADLKNHRIVTFGEPVHAADQRPHLHQARCPARCRYRHAARLSRGEGFRTGAALAGDGSAVLRHLFLLPRRDEKSGKAARVPRFCDREGA